MTSVPPRSPGETSRRFGRTPRRPPARVRAVLALVGLVATGACGYGFSSRSTGGLDTIAIRTFGNRTSQPDLEVTIWEKVVELFDQDRLLKVVDEERAQSVLEATLVDYRREPISINPELGAEEYRVTLVLEASFTDQRTSEEMWSGVRFRGTGNYLLEGGDVTFEDALDEAVGEIVEDLLNRIIGDW
jgi:hypothetical protein